MNTNNLLMDISILYRCTQKYYDKQLSEFPITAGQLPFLILIYENEGISMQQLAVKGSFDKGTITKTIAKLEQAGYVHSTTCSNDHRVRLLYTSDQTKEIISKIYHIRQEWWQQISQVLYQQEKTSLISLLEKVTNQAIQYEQFDQEDPVKIFGLQKLTLLDYPETLASTIFTGGCNMRCPFCQNKELVFIDETMKQLACDDILAFLHKRKHVLEGVCISGGEPLINPRLKEFLIQIKQMGYQVKLDTNGSYPKKLKELVDEGLIDYVAMDIKNCLEKYPETVGVENFDITPIKESVSYLLSNPIPYEFRTTVVKEFHTADDFKKIASWIKGANAYYLQQFQDCDTVIQKGLHAYNEQDMQTLLQIILPLIPNAKLRGL